MKSIGIIPARFASSRFPGKPLADIGGMTMIERVYRQARKASSLSEVVVATDDERIFRHVQGFGGHVVMTRPDHTSGTDRCAEVADLRVDVDIVVNIQGDEPFIDPVQIDRVVVPFRENVTSPIATLACPIKSGEDIVNPNIVKVVFDNHGKALYFSRSPVPFVRNLPQEKWIALPIFFKHIGLYAFRRGTLMEITKLQAGRYETAESLEQLRWLEEGYSIAVHLTDLESMGVDTPEDLDKIRQWFLSFKA